ncbi:MAG: universal stress protein [Pseudobdellovibrio sp.]
MLQQYFKTIIVGVDFSDYSKIVVKQAQLLGQLWNAKLVLVHAIQDPIEYAPSIYNLSYPNLSSPKTYLIRMSKKYEIEKKSATLIALYGSAVPLLLQTAKKYPEPLIMIGHRGQNKISTFMFGSTAQELIKKSKKSLWIHRGSKVVHPQKILIPHDLSIESNRSIDVVRKLSFENPSSYEVFFVKEKEFPVLNYKDYPLVEGAFLKNAQAKIKNIFKEYPEVSFVTAKGNVTNKIVKHTKKFDLLVMTHHSPTGLFSKSETIELLKDIKTPMLVAH